MAHQGRIWLAVWMNDAPAKIQTGKFPLLSKGCRELSAWIEWTSIQHGRAFPESEVKRRGDALGEKCGEQLILHLPGAHS